MVCIASANSQRVAVPAAMLVKKYQYGVGKTGWIPEIVLHVWGQQRAQGDHGESERASSNRKWTTAFMRKVVVISRWPRMQLGNVQIRTWARQASIEDSKIHVSLVVD